MKTTSVILPLILAKRSHCFILPIVKLSREFQSSSPTANICHLAGQVSPGLTHLWEEDTHSDGEMWVHADLVGFKAELAFE